MCASAPAGDLAGRTEVDECGVHGVLEAGQFTKLSAVDNRRGTIRVGVPDSSPAPGALVTPSSSSGAGMADFHHSRESSTCMPLKRAAIAICHPGLAVPVFAQKPRFWFIRHLKPTS